MKRLFSLLTLLSISLLSFAQVPSPDEFFGFSPENQFLEWGDVLSYSRELARTSEKVRFNITGRSFEQRPFIELIISSEENLAKLDKIKEQHLLLSNPSASEGLDTSDMPLIVEVMGSMHGNENSGVNSTVQTAYFLATAPEAEAILQNAVIIIVPGLNPDGINFAASWVNGMSSFNPVSDVNSLEARQSGKPSRANHYWHDCNRDWLSVQFPEGRNGVKIYMEWRPNVVLDLHEMRPKKDGLYYFSPGAPNRTHPFIPAKNQELTREIGKETGSALDSLGVKNYSGKNYDDFFIGKGAAYGDIQGSVCILHEQAGLHCHVKPFQGYGEVTFGETVRNQREATKAVIRKSVQMRQTLLEYQKEFFINAAKASKLEKNAAWAFKSKNGDKAMEHDFIDILLRHGIEVFKIEKKDGGYAVPFNQPQYYKVKCLFEDITEYADSTFYDVSTWNTARAFNLDLKQIRKIPENSPKLTDLSFPEGLLTGNAQTATGFKFTMKDYYAPKFIASLQSRKIKVLCNDKGELFVPATEKDSDFILKTAGECAVDIACVEKMPSDFKEIRTPKTLLYLDETGQWRSLEQLGGFWYLLDYRYGMNHALVNKNRICDKVFKWDEYNSMVLVGNVSMPKGDINKMRSWIEDGGILICTSEASGILKTLGIGNVAIDFKDTKPLVKGLCVKAVMDLSSPLMWGYEDKSIDIFKRLGSTYKEIEGAKSAMWIAPNPYLSGCVSNDKLQKIANAPIVQSISLGRGKIIFFSEDFNFRSYWRGTSHLLTNALFFADRL